MKRKFTIMVDATDMRMSSIAEQFICVLGEDRYLRGLVTEMRFTDDGLEDRVDMQKAMFSWHGERA